jgi:hypothetical protein
MFKDHMRIGVAQFSSASESCDLFLEVAMKNNLNGKGTIFCMDKIGKDNRCYEECEDLKEAVREFGVKGFQKYWRNDSVWEIAKPVLEKIETELNKYFGTPKKYSCS